MVTTFKEPIINKRAEKAQIMAAYRERCKLIRQKTGRRKGITVKFLREQLNTDSIKDYSDFRNILCGFVYKPELLDQYEAYVDQVLELENQKNHEPII